MDFNEKLVSVINSNEDIKRYKELEVIINNDKKLLEQLEQLKQVQKQIVHAEKLEKSEMLINLNEKYNILLDEIENYPLMSEYLHIQNNLNYVLQDFKSIIEKGIDDDIMGK